MKANIGSTDKLLRLALAIVLILLFYKEILIDMWGVIALLLALLLTISSLINFCPLYALFRINTAKRKKKKEDN